MKIVKEETKERSLHSKFREILHGENENIISNIFYGDKDKYCFPSLIGLSLEGYGRVSFPLKEFEFNQIRSFFKQENSNKM